MMILGEKYDERYGFDCDNYDPYDPFDNDDIVTYCDVIDNCEECPRYGDNCDGNFDEEDEMNNGWIDTRTSEPTKDGTYFVQMAGGYLAGLSYTTEGGWNTSYDTYGELQTEAAMSSVSVVRWFDAPQPPEIPKAWREEWLHS